MLYSIYEDYFKDVEKKLKRIEKKCAKYGNPFVFNVIDTEIKEIIDEETKSKRYYRFIIIEVEGTAKINDYECVAILENHNFGNVIRRIDTEIEIPKRFLSTDNICEHCRSKRKRNELYIIHNVKTDEFKQVGSNCLMSYTNGLNAEYIASYFDGITELEEFDGFIGNGGKCYMSINEAIEYSIEIIDKIGYFNSNSYCPTKDLVGTMLYGIGDLKNRIENLNEILRDNKINMFFKLADFCKESTKITAEKIIEHYLNLKNDSEFINNVQVILKDGYVDYKNLGYICYLSEGYFKHIQKENKKAERLKIDGNSKHFGEINIRYNDINIAKIEEIASYSTQYGVNYIYKIILESGDILIWKTSKWIDDFDIVKSITFTVKNHGEYNGVKQTEITRCKLNVK